MMMSAVAFECNHAQGVAHAATARGLQATILMPEDSPRVKITGTRAFGGTVITYDRYSENREEIGERMAAETGAVLIRPYEDTRIIAGQGTVGLEIVAQCAAMGVTPDHLVCCCGGGGLIAGISTVLRAKMPATRIWAAEPSGYDDTIRSLRPATRTCRHFALLICDAIVTPQPGEPFLRSIRKHLPVALPLRIPRPSKHGGCLSSPQAGS